MYNEKNQFGFSEKYMEEETGAPSSSDERAAYINKELLKNMLIIKPQTVDQCPESFNEPIEEDCLYKPGNGFFKSEKLMPDHSPIRDEHHFDNTEKDIILNDETHHQLNGNSADFMVCTISKENGANFTVCSIGEENHADFMECTISEENHADFMACTVSEENHADFMECTISEENGNGITSKYPREDKAPQLTRSEWTCSLCGRCFKSMKSLSGHMRWHPERNWRGIQPPATVKIDDQNNSGTATENLAFDQPQSLLHRPAVIKRSWNRISVHAPKSHNHLKDLEVSEIEAVDSLLALAYADPMELAFVERKQTHEHSKVKFLDFACKNLGVYEGANISGNGLRSECVKMDSREENVPKLEMMNYTRPIKKFTHQTEFRKILKKNNTRSLKTTNGKKIFSASARYICGTCKKSFPSHQALGGHAGSHKAAKSSSMLEVEVLEFTRDVDDQYVIVGPTHSKRSLETDEAWLNAEMVHHCKTCNKTFPSGQALGGHQRCHWGSAVKVPVIPVLFQGDDRTVCLKANIGLSDFPMGETS